MVARGVTRERSKVGSICRSETQVRLWFNGTGLRVAEIPPSSWAEWGTSPADQVGNHSMGQSGLRNTVGFGCGSPQRNPNWECSKW
jgi:hypothetical protein